MLRVLTERHRAEQQPLFCAFVDFRKAYDTVPRDLLWAKLKARGVHGHMLDSLKALYADVPISVKTAAGTTLPFQSTLGLKQGDPSSPNLFGLFIDDLEPAIMALGDAAALPMLDNTTMPPLLHADDLALLSTSAEGLQVQIDCLAGYAHRWGLTVSLAKTKVMVFRRDKARPPMHLKLQGQALQQVDTFRYLGVCVHAWELFGPTSAAARLDAARRSLGGMRGRCARLGLTNAKAHCSLFDTLVRPSLSYGSETGRLGSSVGRWHRLGMRTVRRFTGHSCGGCWECAARRQTWLCWQNLAGTHWCAPGQGMCTASGDGWRCWMISGGW